VAKRGGGDGSLCTGQMSKALLGLTFSLGNCDKTGKGKPTVIGLSPYLEK